MIQKKRSLLFLILAFFVFGCSLHRTNAPQADASAVAGAQELAAADGDTDDAANGELIEDLPVEIPENGSDGQWQSASVVLPDADLPVELNDRVLAWINYFTGRGRPIYTKWLKRQEQIQPYIEEILKQYDLPLDLVYLAMIESGLNPKAYSHARASGLWQFMQGTGRNYGLKVDYWIDERRDFEKATHAAARHLSDLHTEFNDWYLAMAAYNAGSGKVQRAIRKHGTRDFWELAAVRRPYLRSETRNYVPKMLAALIIGKQPQRFGFGPKALEANEGEIVEEFHPYTACDMVEVDEPTDLSAIAKCAGVELDVIRTLNPEIRYQFTPPGVKNYSLRLPEGARDRFMTEYEKLPKGRRVDFIRHVLKPGQNLGGIASRYGTSVAAIMKLNEISNAKRIRAGKVLLIPVPIGRKNPDLVSTSPTVAAPRKTPKLKSKTLLAPALSKTEEARLEHTVKTGETLWSLAQQYGVTINALRRWNALKTRATIYPGDVLTIYRPRA